MRYSSHAFACILFFASVANAQIPSKTDLMELPSDQEVSSLAGAFEVILKLNGDPKDFDDVKWIISNTASDKKRNPIRLVLLKKSNNGIIFILPQTDDLVTILAFTAYKGRVTDPVATVVQVNGPDKPAPIPGPVPKPVPSSQAKHVSFILQDGKTSDLANDQTMAKWFQDKGLLGHLLYLRGGKVVQPTGVEVKNMITEVNKVGIPCIIVQDDRGNILASGLLTTAANVYQMIGPYVR